MCAWYDISIDIHDFNNNIIKYLRYLKNHIPFTFAHDFTYATHLLIHIILPL